MFIWSRTDAPGPGRRGVRFAFTSRHGGASAPPWDSLNLGGGSGDDPQAVEHNRRVVAAELAVPRDRLLFMRQCHGAEVCVATAPWGERAGGPPEVDALVTTRDDLAVAALAADCVPVLLADAQAGVVAAVHSGRPGLAQAVVVRAVERMRGLGATRISGVVGPAVCGRCYEVPAAMRDEVAAVVPESACTSWSGTPALDIAAGVVAQLRGAGVEVEHVSRCTRESPELYSYRRDGATGRFAGVIRLLPALPALPDSSVLSFSLPVRSGR